MLTKDVGAAVGRNPLSVVVPCHRVIGKDGRLTGARAAAPGSWSAGPLLTGPIRPGDMIQRDTIQRDAHPGQSSHPPGTSSD